MPIVCNMMYLNLMKPRGPDNLRNILCFNVAIGLKYSLLGHNKIDVHLHTNQNPLSL